MATRVYIEREMGWRRYNVVVWEDTRKPEYSYLWHVYDVTIDRLGWDYILDHIAEEAAYLLGKPVD